MQSMLGLVLNVPVMSSNQIHMAIASACTLSCRPAILFVYRSLYEGQLWCASCIRVPAYDVLNFNCCRQRLKLAAVPVTAQFESLPTELTLTIS